MSFWAVSGVALVTAAVLMTATAVIARRVGRIAVVDVTWGLGFVAIALVSALFGGGVGEGTRRWLLLAVVAVWGLRLAWHIRRRAVGHGSPPAEDPRYAELIGDGGFGVAIRKVFVVQGLALWFISLPLQAGATLTVRWWALVWVGLAVSLIGIVFESVGDAQLAAYKRDPDRPTVMDRGLWRYTRHPNYFGDACVWWGLWLAGGLASGWLPGLLTALAPVAMTYFLVFATGARLLERTMMQREGYPEYAERTSMFVPLPPRG